MENIELKRLNGIAKQLDPAKATKVMPSMDMALQQIEKALASLSAGIAELEKSKSITVSDITGLADEQLDALLPGNKVIKETETASHVYTVSYKDDENGGLCLTYTDASVVETVSYDHTESGWVYNSTDVTPLSPGGGGGEGGGGGLAPMLVHGSILSLGNAQFTADEGQPTWDEAYEHFTAGGTVLLSGTTEDDNIPFAESVTTYGMEDGDEFLSCYNLWWPKPAGGIN